MSLRGGQATRQSRGFLFYGLAGSSLHGARFVIGGFTDWSMGRGLLLEGSRIGPWGAAIQGIPFSRTRRLVPPWGAVCYWRVHGLVHGARFVIGGFTDWSMGRGLLLEGSRIGPWDAAIQGIPFSRTRRLVPPWGAVCYWRDEPASPLGSLRGFLAP